MRKGVALLVGIFVILCGIASLAGASVPLIPDFPGWDWEIPEGGQLARFTLPGEDGDVRAMLFVSRLSYSSEEEAEAFEKALKEQLTLDKGAVSILEVEEKLFQGRSWVVHHLRGETPGEEGEAPEVFEAEKFLTREGDMIYSFQFITYPEHFAELRPHFLECMEMITFEEEPPTSEPPAQASSAIPKLSEEDDFVDKLTSKKAAPSTAAIVPVQEALAPSPTPSASAALPVQPPVHGAVQTPAQHPVQAPVQLLPAPAAPPASAVPGAPSSPGAAPQASSGMPQGLGALAPPQPVPAPPSRFTLEIFPGPEWTANPPLDPSISQYYLLIQQGVNMAEMMVFEEDFDAPVTLQSYAQIILSQAPQLFAGYNVGQNWETTINGVPMKVHEFFFLAPGTYTRLIGRAYIFMGGPQRGYVVLFDTADQSYPYMAPKFDAVMRTLNLRPEIPVSSPGQPGYPQMQPQPQQLQQPQSQPLPGTGGLPAFGGSPDPGIYEDLSKGLRVTLPSGAVLTETFPQGRRYTLADGADLVLLNLASPQEVESLVAQLVQGKAFQGESLIQARGTSGQVALYASSHPQTSVPYATLAARYPQASLLMILTLPRDNYQRAAGWMLPFLESVSLGR